MRLLVAGVGRELWRLQVAEWDDGLPELQIDAIPISCALYIAFNFIEWG